MPNFFAVMSDSPTMPELYLFQKSPYDEVLRSCRAHPESHNHRTFVYELRSLTPKFGAAYTPNPTGAVQLALVGIVEPSDNVQYYRGLWSSAVDHLPTEQALHELQLAQDHLERTRMRIESSSKQLEPVPVPEEEG